MVKYQKSLYGKILVSETRFYGKILVSETRFYDKISVKLYGKILILETRFYSYWYQKQVFIVTGTRNTFL